MLAGGSKLIALLRSPRVLWRAFWVLMLGLHLGPILSLSGAFGTTTEADRGVRLALLLASSLFFALKIADVRWLRLLPGWRSTVVSVMVLALLHLGPIERAAGTHLIGGEAKLVLFAGGAFALDSVQCGLRRIRLAFVARFAQCRPRFSIAALARSDALRPPRWWIDISHLAPRAPPVR